MLYAPSGLESSRIGYPVEITDYVNASVCTVPYITSQVLRHRVPVYDNNNNSYSTRSLYKVSPHTTADTSVQMHIVKKEVKAEATEFLS